MIRVTLSALLGHWFRNPLQLFTLLSGLALATALWSGVQAINAEARASYDAAAATLGEGQFDRLTRRDGQPILQETYVQLRRAGWLVSPVIEGRIDGTRIIAISGLEPGPEIGTLVRALEEEQAAGTIVDEPAAIEFIERMAPTLSAQS